MKAKIAVAASDNVTFKPAPISPDHVLAGRPEARNAVVFTSADKLQITLMWHCTAGSFRWFYDEDETCLVMEGGMTLHFDNGSQRSCGPGDLLFFPAGTTCVWVIDKEVRKAAFFREPAPQMVALPMRALRKLIDRSGVRAWLRRRQAEATPNRIRLSHPVI
jgi:uncharacterized cupin superfamily protein